MNLILCLEYLMRWWVVEANYRAQLRLKHVDFNLLPEQLYIEENILNSFYIQH